MKAVHAFETVLHPTDFSEASLTAFYHALKAALLTKSKLTLLNVSAEGKPVWSNFPGIRETLARWHLLPPNCARSEVGRLGVRAEKIVTGNQFLDALRGSHSERVLRYGVAPLLTVPVGELAATDPHLDLETLY